MKHDCDIVRDLMPLCIDDTASEKTKQMVTEHMEECTPCSGVYEEMRKETKIELPVQSASPEFATAVKKMKSRRKRRIWLILLLGVLLAGMVALVGMKGYYWYFIEKTQLEDVQLSVVSSTDGIALIHASNVPRSATMVIELVEMEYPESALGQCEGQVYISATRYEAKNDMDDVYFVVGNVEDGHVLATDEWGNEVPVYRMMLAPKYNRSGQVFYVSGEGELEVISLQGVNLKSLARSYYTDKGASVSVPFSSTPTPTTGFSTSPLSDATATTTPRPSP